MMWYGGGDWWMFLWMLLLWAGVIPSHPLVGTAVIGNLAPRQNIKG